MKPESNIRDTTLATGEHHHTNLKPLVLLPSKSWATVHVFDKQYARFIRMKMNSAATWSETTGPGLKVKWTVSFILQMNRREKFKVNVECRNELVWREGSIAKQWTLKWSLCNYKIKIKFSRYTLAQFQNLESVEQLFQVLLVLTLMAHSCKKQKLQTVEEVDLMWVCHHPAIDLINFYHTNFQSCLQEYAWPPNKK